MSVIKPLIDSSYIQLCDENGTPLSGKSTVSHANKNGLWHLGVHVVIINKDLKTMLIQKRSSRMFTNPSRVELSLGGALKYGETPKEAALREAYEETGITAPASALQFISNYRYNQIFPKLGIHSKVYGYSYLLFVEEKFLFTPHDQESSEASFIPYSDARTLIKKGSHPLYGRLASDHTYYIQLLKSINSYL